MWTKDDAYRYGTYLAWDAVGSEKPCAYSRWPEMAASDLFGKLVLCNLRQGRASCEDTPSSASLGLGGHAHTTQHLLALSERCPVLMSPAGFVYHALEPEGRRTLCRGRVMDHRLWAHRSIVDRALSAHGGRMREARETRPLVEGWEHPTLFACIAHLRSVWVAASRCTGGSVEHVLIYAMGI